MNKQNSANGLALTSAYLFIMICQLMIPHYFRNGPVYLICTLIWLLGASAMIFLNRRFSFKNPVDSTEKCTQATHEAILIGLGLIATLAAQILLTTCSLRLFINIRTIFCVRSLRLQLPRNLSSENSSSAIFQACSPN